MFGARLVKHILECLDVIIPIFAFLVVGFTDLPLTRRVIESFLKPGSLLDHKETFEKLLPPADFADISFNLEPGVDPQTRRDAVRSVLAHAKPRTLFDLEALPSERRGKIWEGLVDDADRRLELDKLRTIYERKPKTEFRSASVIRRARKNLADMLTLTRDKSGMREDITLFMLIRLEAAIAALRRFLKPPQAPTR